jgi:hypothetical protein
MSKEFERKHGDLNLSNSLNILRRVYSGRADLILNIMRIFGKGHGFMESCNQWSANPLNGDILLSFADDIEPAQFNDINYFNFFDLLNSDPP